jgi:zinc carboxypeptidase
MIQTLSRMLRPALLVLVLAAPAAAAPPPSPESVLGFPPGADRQLADWTQIVDYFRRLDAASDRVRVQEIGRTTEDRPFLVAVITSEANMERLEEIRRTNLRLADPRGLRPEEAERLIARGKTIVAVNHGIHSDEVAATQTAMETAYALASGDTPEIHEILDNTVVVMIPSHNPDGAQRVTEWYRRSLGTPWEGHAPPFLYQKYTGHDNNRDWYMFTQRESRLTLQGLYHPWRPQIVHDIHQMDARAARLFAPPYVDPWEPNVDPALVAAVNGLGMHVAARLTSEGHKGVVSHAIYDAWSPSRAYPHTHGGVRLLTESAEARMATPIDVRFDDLEPGIGYDPRERSWNFPDPWKGGPWRLRDIVDDQRAATRAILEHAARNRTYWLRTFYEVSRRATLRSEPYAFVVPTAQHDPLATAKLLEVLRLGGVEVHRARAPFTAGERTVDAGSWVVLMAQPYSAFAKTVLERQHYPDIRQYPGGPAQRPYDATAHTLPLLLGVEVTTVAAPFAADLELVTQTSVRPGLVRGHGPWLALGHRTGELVALGRLLRERVPVRWATAEFTDAGQRFPAGTLLVPASARARLQPMAHELGIVAHAVAAAPPALVLRAPRVGLYQSWVPAIDEGWTRFVFEQQAGVDYQTLHDRDVQAGGLRDRFDVIVLPSQSTGAIVTGYPPGTMPEEYTGGLGAKGVEELKAFAEAGGTLVALDAAARLAVRDFGLGVRDVLAVERPQPGAAAPPRAPVASDFFCPGALLRVTTAPHPLAAGLDPSAAIWFEESPAFEVERGTVVARYPEENPLLSGWLLGERRLFGKAALVEAPLGRGRVVLFGFRPQYRAQSWATYPALLNAIYTSAATPAPAPLVRRPR